MAKPTFKIKLSKPEKGVKEMLDLLNKSVKIYAKDFRMFWIGVLVQLPDEENEYFKIRTPYNTHCYIDSYSVASIEGEHKGIKLDQDPNKLASSPGNLTVGEKENYK